MSDLLSFEKCLSILMCLLTAWHFLKTLWPTPRAQLAEQNESRRDPSPPRVEQNPTRFEGPYSPTPMTSTPVNPFITPRPSGPADIAGISDKDEQGEETDKNDGNMEGHSVSGEEDETATLEKDISELQKIIFEIAERQWNS